MVGHAIIVVGASLGGVETLSKLVSRLPADLHAAVFVVLHVPAGSTSALSWLLDRAGPLPAREATDGEAIHHGRIYVARPDHHLLVKPGYVRVVRGAKENRHRPAIDPLFRSAAAAYTSRVVGVVLTGLLDDGTAGLLAIKEGGGMGVAQDPDTAEFAQMPRSAIGTGVVDYVLRVEDMPDRLVRYIRHLRGLDLSLQRAPLGDDDKLRRICVILRERTGHDFSHYKPNTMVRRIQRRLQVNHVDNIDTYIQRLREDAEEADLLFKELLIGVTQFFRDPEAFEALVQEVIPQIFAQKDNNSPVRVWVAGCSTGEEAYSIAILMAEHERRTGLSAPVQVFATDIDQRALDFARLGRYPQGIADQISKERLDRYFQRVGETYQVASEIREMCVFSAHDLLRDPPFSRLDLVSCRNLLIYLQPEAQRGVMPLLHYALRRGDSSSSATRRMWRPTRTCLRRWPGRATSSAAGRRSRRCRWGSPPPR